MREVSGIRAATRRRGAIRCAGCGAGCLRRRVVNSRQSLTCHPARAIEELGLPQTPIDEALEEAVDWFRANGYVR